jgi:hypothetical protein
VIPLSARSPLFTARIDHARAIIRARGRLDRVGADLLRGTVEALQREGHRSITLELADLTGPQPEADAVLSGMVRELSAVGARVVVRRKPSWDAALPGLADPAVSATSTA